MGQVTITGLCKRVTVRVGGMQILRVLVLFRSTDNLEKLRIIICTKNYSGLDSVSHKLASPRNTVCEAVP
jgi:hypothetical protein